VPLRPKYDKGEFVRLLWTTLFALISFIELAPLGAKETYRTIAYSEFQWSGLDLTDKTDGVDLELIKGMGDSVQAVLVPGFFHEWCKGYMDPLRHWLSDNKIDHVTAATRSDRSSGFNAEKIATEISVSKRKVLLIAHSRGGVDALEAMIRFPELQSKLFGIIFIQSPFYGTWVADFFAPARRPRNSVDGWDRFLIHTRLLPDPLKQRLYGIWQSTKSLTASERQKWMGDHAFEIARLFSMTPVVTLTSYDRSFFRLRVFEIFRKLMQLQGIVSDGVVPEASMQISGVPRITVKDADHAGLVFSSRRSPTKHFGACNKALSYIMRASKVK